MLSQELRQEIRKRLETVFEGRLQGVLLYGSKARDEARDESDVDLLVLLDGPVRLGRDLETIVRALYPLQLEIEDPIHATPVSAEVFAAGEYGLYRSAQREGILL
ncbi:MAG: nucleotidyltransferase domain-containing protein [Anaerolineales bacterium]